MYLPGEVDGSSWWSSPRPKSWVVLQPFALGCPSFASIVTEITSRACAPPLGFSRLVSPRHWTWTVSTSFTCSATVRRSRGAARTGLTGASTVSTLRGMRFQRERVSSFVWHGGGLVAALVVASSFGHYCNARAESAPSTACFDGVFWYPRILRRYSGGETP